MRPGLLFGLGQKTPETRCQKLTIYHIIGEHGPIAYIFWRNNIFSGTI